ncbi:NAD(P)-binding protein [Gymnopus androsaceus JB14]|uniref:NAD(P)-binding protein n=1 Tax=Gymnopus androsaceus JB14 TaxID=1447944 RepID=A0A6A4ICK6_9AGAR|nr:NAD(P)-binding protein [Gymnopus androsaceus JB14]
MGQTQAPSTTKAVVVRKSNGKSNSGYVNDATLETLPLPQLKSGEILVKMHAVAFNHRDVWIRKGMYPGVQTGSVFGADGAGVVVASGDANDNAILNRRVFLAPSHGWDDDPDAPEGPFGVIGGVRWPALGTFAEYVVVEKDKVISSASHLSDTDMAAWPLAGLTAWRATMINAAVQRGQNILITGIGGGVALVALQLAVAQGASVYVTSGSQEKIDKAIALGALGGASYKNADWPKQIHKLVRKNNPAGFSATLDAVIDSGGGDIMSSVGSILKQGGRVVCYGMTANPKITFTMREVMRNQKLIGSTMGSMQDLRDATEFLSKHEIVPVVSHVFHGLENAEKGFEMLKSGEQFGKVVIEVGGYSGAKMKSKL